MSGFDRFFEVLSKEHKEADEEAKRQAWYASLIPVEWESDYGVTYPTRWAHPETGELDPEYPEEST